MIVNRLSNLQRALAKIKANVGDPNTTVVVGFTQRYALVVHENLNARHAEGKKAKYLEGPAREHQKTIADIVAKVYARTKSMSDALLMAGLRLQREAQLVVPIDTSALKASAFTTFQKDLDAAAAVAFQKSEQIRVAEEAKRSKKGKLKALKSSMKSAKLNAKKAARLSKKRSSKRRKKK